MAEEEIRIPFNRHKLDALKVALYTAGKDFDKEIADLLRVSVRSVVIRLDNLGLTK